MSDKPYSKLDKRKEEYLTKEEIQSLRDERAEFVAFTKKLLEYSEYQLYCLFIIAGAAIFFVIRSLFS